MVDVQRAKREPHHSREVRQDCEQRHGVHAARKADQEIKRQMIAADNQRHADQIAATKDLATQAERQRGILAGASPEYFQSLDPVSAEENALYNERNAMVAPGGELSQERSDYANDRLTPMSQPNPADLHSLLMSGTPTPSGVSDQQQAQQDYQGKIAALNQAGFAGDATKLNDLLSESRGVEVPTKFMGNELRPQFGEEGVRMTAPHIGSDVGYSTGLNPRDRVDTIFTPQDFQTSETSPVDETAKLKDLLDAYSNKGVGQGPAYAQNGPSVGAIASDVSGTQTPSAKPYISFGGLPEQLAPQPTPMAALGTAGAAAERKYQEDREARGLAKAEEMKAADYKKAMDIDKANNESLLKRASIEAYPRLKAILDQEERDRQDLRETRDFAVTHGLWKKDKGGNVLVGDPDLAAARSLIHQTSLNPPASATKNGPEEWNNAADFAALKDLERQSALITKQELEDTAGLKPPTYYEGLRQANMTKQAALYQKHAVGPTPGQKVVTNLGGAAPAPRATGTQPSPFYGED